MTGSNSALKTDRPTDDSSDRNYTSQTQENNQKNEEPATSESTLPTTTGVVGGKIFYIDAYRKKELTNIDIEDNTTPEEEIGEPPDRSLYYARTEPVESKRPSQAFTRVMRAAMVNPILKCLGDVAPCAGTPDAAMYVGEIFRNIRALEMASPDDPFLEILAALRMALSYDNRWVDYRHDQLLAARQILQDFANRPILEGSDVEHAIFLIEDRGFDTTPIAVSFDEEDS